MFMIPGGLPYLHSYGYGVSVFVPRLFVDTGLSINLGQFKNQIILLNIFQLIYKNHDICLLLYKNHVSQPLLYNISGVR